MNSGSGGGLQPGWCMNPSSSKYGTSSRLAIRRASVDFPAPVDPTTETRRTAAPLRRGGGHQLREVDAHVGQSRFAHGPATFDQLATQLGGLRVVHPHHPRDDAVAEIDNRERKDIAVTAPHGAVDARCVAPIFHAHVALVGPA